MFDRNTKRLLYYVILCFGMSPGLLGQISTASLAGTVRDSFGAAVPGAEVAVKNTETNEARHATTGGDGSYLVVSLPVGKYQVSASARGFKTKIETGIQLVVGQQAELNVVLEVGEVSESVTVSDVPAVVNTSTSSVAGLVGEKEVKDLPLNGRSFDNLITLNTSAINYTSFSGTATTGGGPGNSFAVAGRRPWENIFLLNGIEYTGESNRSNEPGGVSGQLLGVDAVREFNVLTDTYSAEYGKRPGAQINVVTESGSNDIHGTVFEFLRNSAMDARNYFDAPVAQIGRRIPEFQRNQFGGSLGGPLLRNKVFAFTNYEGFRQRLGVSDLAPVPDGNARNGMLPNSMGVPTPVTDADPRMLPFFALWPQANGAELGGGVAYYAGSPKESIREDFGTTRFDQNLSSKDSLSEIYTIDDGTSAVPQQNPFFYADYYVRNQVLSAQELHIFSPNTMNTGRVGLSRAAFTFNIAPAPGTTFPSNLSFFSGFQPGQLTIGGGLTTLNGSTTVAGVGGTANDLFGVRNLFTYADDFQLIRGKHHFSFGGWAQRLQDNRSGANRKAGAVSFSTLTTFIQGIESNFQGTPDPQYSGYRLWMGAWYAQDNIKLTPRLVVNLGIRHEMTTIMSEVHGHIANALLDANGIMETTPLIGKPFPSNNALRNFGPRVGLAWDVFGNDKTSLRSGFGLHYSLMDYELWIFDSISPFNTNVAYPSNQSFPSLIPVTTGVPGPPACGPGVSGSCQIVAQKGIISNADPAVAEWNLSIEQQIGTKTSLRIEYAGSHGYHEPMEVDRNSIPPIICSNTAGCTSGGLNSTHATVPQGTLYVPVSSSRPNPYLGSSDETMFSDSSYNSLQAEVRRQLSHGLQFRANYTFSKSLDISDTGGGTQEANAPPLLTQPWNPRSDWGPASFDVRNIFGFSGTYDLPFGAGKYWLANASGFTDKLVNGWQVNTIASLLSGFPFTPLDGADQSGNGNTANPDRPSLNPAFRSPIITHNPNQWYNPNAFILPPSGTFGDLGKGSLRGPGLASWDLSLMKNTQLTERFNWEFRFEAFNVLNHTNFSFPNQTVFAGSVIGPTAGLITATATTSRQLQIGLKLMF